MIEIDVLPASTDAKSADSILIRIGEFSYLNPSANKQKVILIDGGYTENAETIEKYLNDYYETNRIDYAFLTHPDSDHILGFKELLSRKNITISQTMISDPWEYANHILQKSEDGRRTINSINNKLDENLSKLPEILDMVEDINTNALAGAGINLFDYKISVLGPDESYYKNLLLEFPGMAKERTRNNVSVYNDREVPYNSSFKHFLDNPLTSAKNDSSLILLLSYNTHDNKTPIALFTGDAGVEAITKAIYYTRKNNIMLSNIPLMQLPHHGSIKNINEKIIDYIAPQKIFVSAGKDDEEHPAKLVINCLLEKKIKVRTITGNGGIVFYFDCDETRPGWVSPSETSMYSNVQKLKEDK